MRMSLAAATLLLAGGTVLAPVAAMAQATNTPATTPSTAPQVAPSATTPSTTMSAPSTTHSTGSQTPAASVNTTPQSTSSPSPSSVQTRNTNNRTAAAPVPGRNSFTMSQASRRIAAAGYTKVEGLKKDNQGIWRGQAQKDGNPVSVSLDYQGNVTGQ